MKKKNSRFSLVRRGYSVSEVDLFLKSEYERCECTYNEQKERIANLVEEIVNLKRQLKEYVDKESQISSALVTATEKAEKMNGELRLRYTMELDRLNTFRAKWTGVYQELKDRYGFNGDALNVESVAVSTRLEIERILQRDFSLAKGEEMSAAELAFKSEADRLSESAGVEELKSKLLDAMKNKEKVACHFD